jgi:hypothetical protein
LCLFFNGLQNPIAGLKIRVSTVQLRPSAPPQSPRPTRACWYLTSSGTNTKYPENAPAVSKTTPAANQSQPTTGKQMEADSHPPDSVINHYPAGIPRPGWVDIG